MAEQSLVDSAENHHAEFLQGTTREPWALSVFSHPTIGVAGICRRAWPILQHGKIRVSTVGVLRDLGYDVIPDGSKGHSLIPLSSPPWDWPPLTDVGFLPAQPNPEKQRREEARNDVA
jgi:hypothetical protein